MRTTLTTLLAHRDQPGRLFFVLAAIPLFLTGLVGAEYGAFVPYAILASICVVQAVYPTLLGWALAAAIYGAASAAYLYALVRDIIELARGKQPNILLNPTDSAVFVLFELVLVAIAIALFVHRPKPRPAN